MNKEDVEKYIWNIKDKKEIRHYWDILKQRNKQLEEQLCYQFRKGDKVTFTHKGIVKNAVVDKINTKSVSVHEEPDTWHRWNVAPSLLTKVDD